MEFLHGTQNTVIMMFESVPRERACRIPAEMMINYAWPGPCMHCAIVAIVECVHIWQAIYSISIVVNAHRYFVLGVAAWPLSRHVNVWVQICSRVGHPHTSQSPSHPKTSHPIRVFEEISRRSKADSHCCD